MRYEAQIPAWARVYLDPRAPTTQDLRGRADGLYLDLRGVAEVSPAYVVDALRAVGLDPKGGSRSFEVLALIDPESPPKGLELIGSLWRLVAVLDIGVLRSLHTLEMAQRSFKDIAVRIDTKNLRLSLGVIALVTPSYSIVPGPSIDVLKDLKAYAGASAGELLIELCSPEVPEYLLHFISGVVFSGCGAARS